MMQEKNIKTHKDRKNVKEIEIKKKLEREIEEILGKQITVRNDSKNGSYQIKRKSIYRKDKRN